MNHASLFKNSLRRVAGMPLAFIALIAICTGFYASADEVIPPAPEHYFNDYANVVSAGVAKQIDAELAQFEKETTGQIVVAIFPKMQSDASLADYSHRIFNAWGIGQKSKNNGLLLIIFVQDHKMQIETGLGFEKIVTDEICQKILDQEITPRFRKGDFDGGLTAAVNAMIAATRGEYKAGGTDPANHP